MLRQKKASIGVSRGVSSKTTMPPNQSSPKASKIEMRLRSKINKIKPLKNPTKTSRNYSM
jgi:hypothetical protein